VGPTGGMFSTREKYTPTENLTPMSGRPAPKLPGYLAYVQY